MKRSPDEKLMKPYLLSLMRRHRQLNRMIDSDKSPGKSAQVSQLKRVRLRVKDKIAALQRHYYGRSLVG